jgi:hypothetical protein
MEPNMSTSDDNNTGVTIALIGGGAFLAWLLWPGRGKRKGNSDESDGLHARKPVHVRIRSGDQLDLDGATADLATTVDRARTAGMAIVLTVGDARAGWVDTVLGALKASAVDVYQVKEPAVEVYHPEALAARNARRPHLPGGHVAVVAHTRRWPRHGA